MAGTKVGKITREPGFLYYVGGDGAVMQMPMRGHKGAKKKVGVVKRLPSALCWVAGNGDVMCKKR